MRFVALCLTVTLSTTAAAEPADPNLKFIPSGDPAMARAVAEARATLPAFLEASRHPQAGQEAFSVKVGLGPTGHAILNFAATRFCSTIMSYKLFGVRSDMARAGSVLQVRLDDHLKAALVDAAEREHTTPSQAIRSLIEVFVKDSWRKEAERQSKLVAEAEADDNIMEEIDHLQAWVRD